MDNATVQHSTFLIERHYPVSPQRVFTAFSDPKQKQRWFAEGEKAPFQSFEADFRVGGWERSSFTFGEGTLCRNDSVYLDILPDRRIVIAYTMSVADRRISSSQMTIELIAANSGTKLIFTEQGAYFEGADGPAIRQEGWQKLLDKLGKELAP